MSKDIKILVVTHKDVPIELADDIYVPMLVGPNKDNLHYQKFYRDDDGENIAKKNPNYSELTALYWAWKNLNADYIGLVHYRRLLMNPSDTSAEINQDQLRRMIDRGVEVILPQKRNYYIETTWSHYQHNHNINDLIEVKAILNEKYPNYLRTFDKVMKKRKSHRFNMLIMKKEVLNDYAEWLFTILFELEKRVDISEYDPYQTRIFGFISERLLDVWIETNDIDYDEVPFKFMEKQNWIKKGTKFIMKKVGGTHSAKVKGFN